MDVNEVTLIGNIGGDPEFRNMQNGNEVASFSLATNRRWTDKSSGEAKQQTEWHRCTTFNEHVIKVLKSFVKKGTRIYIRGEIKYRKWVDKTSGGERWATDIVVPAFTGQIIILSGGKEKSAANGATDSQVANQQDENYVPPQGRTAQAHKDFDDDIPF